MFGNKYGGWLLLEFNHDKHNNNWMSTGKLWVKVSLKRVVELITT